MVGVKLATTRDGKPVPGTEELVPVELVVHGDRPGARHGRRLEAFPGVELDSRGRVRWTRPRTAPATPRCGAAATASTAARKSSTPSPKRKSPSGTFSGTLAGASKERWPIFRSTSAGIKSPNPFWLASAPPTNTGDQVMRAFDAGWGGAVWKTLGDPIVNVSCRFGGVDYGGTRMMGLNNIELITDRPLEVNLREISEVKKRYPKHAVIASLMVETKEEWQEIIKQGRGRRRRRPGAQLRLPARHVRARHGLGRRPGAQGTRGDHALGEGVRAGPRSS